MWFPFSRKRKQREKEVDEALDCVISLLNDLLWQMDTLPNAPEFRVRWKHLQTLQKPRLGVSRQIVDPNGYLVPSHSPEVVK